jgi:hypothetical protein
MSPPKDNSCSLEKVTLIAIIVGPCVGVLVCCLATIVTIVRIVYNCAAKKKSRQRTVTSSITNSTVGANNQLSTAYTAVSETFNQPGFQLQNCGNKTE